MCIDAFDNFSSDRIALGYTANGGCFREMVSEHLVGTPSDVDHKILRNTSVERSNGRTILTFTISQHWLYPNASSLGSKDGPFRIMWAIGQVSGGSGCSATIAYHSNLRGVAPLKWLTSGSTPCSSPVPPTPPSKCGICVTGSCAACKPCVNLKTLPACALCWAKGPNGRACLPDCQDAGCWNTTLNLIV
jgi:hypothetical protein